MKKGEHYIGYVERVDFPNKGIVYVENETAQVTVKNVTPGQKIEFSVSKKHGDKIEGRLINVIDKSELEIKSPCEHFGICGGCTYINLPYDEQLKIKNDQIKRLFENILSKQENKCLVEEIKASPKPYGYRNKMEFSFGDEYKGGPLALGMHQRGSFYDIVSVRGCQIVDDDYRKILSASLDYFNGLSFFHRVTHEGFLRHLLVRKASKTGEILVALVTSSKDSDELDLNNKSIDNWKNIILNLQLDGKIAGIMQIINSSIADVIKADSVELLYGRDYINEEILGLRFKISTFSFFQTNSAGAEVLYSTARDYIGDLSIDGKPSATVFDLYSGTGTIAQLMAKVSKKVIGVEIVKEAVEAAKDNAKLNNLDNCEFIAGDVLKVLDEIKDTPDFIILDPPRDGVHPKALKKIIDYGVPRLIYIACKPTSLLRDIEMFHLAGYEVTRLTCVDQFPWTANIETICLLSKK